MKNVVVLISLSLEEKQMQTHPSQPICFDAKEEKIRCKNSILYHTTTHLHEVLTEGLKTRQQLKEEHGITHGLGGGPDTLISFTYDLDMAKTIKSEQQRLIQIAQRQYCWEADKKNDCKPIAELVRNDKIYDKTGQERNGEWLWNKVIHKIRHPEEYSEHYLLSLPRDEEQWKEYTNGWYEIRASKFTDAQTLDAFEATARKNHADIVGTETEITCKPNPHDGINEIRASLVQYLNTPIEERPTDKDYKASIELFNDLKKGHYHSVLCEDPLMVQQDLLDVYRKYYLRDRDLHDGDADPLFWVRIEIPDFASLDPENVGIIQANVSTPIDIAHYRKLELDARKLAKEHPEKARYHPFFNTSRKYRYTGTTIGFELAGAMGEVRVHPRFIRNIEQYHPDSSSE